VLAVIPVQTTGALALRLNLGLLVVPATVLAAAIAWVASAGRDVPVENLDDGGGGGGGHEAEGKDRLDDLHDDWNK
jgi:hypothetical protein